MATSVAPLSEAQLKFLEECEEQFKDRYTDADSDFVKVRDRPVSVPPIEHPWVTRDNRRGGRGRGFGHRNYGNRDSGYGNRNRDYGGNRDDYYNNRNRGYYDRNRDSDRNRSYRDDRNRDRDESNRDNDSNRDYRSNRDRVERDRDNHRYQPY